MSGALATPLSAHASRRSRPPASTLACMVVPAAVARRLGSHTVSSGRFSVDPSRPWPRPGPRCGRGQAAASARRSGEIGSGPVLGTGAGSAPTPGRGPASCGGTGPAQPGRRHRLAVTGGACRPTPPEAGWPGPSAPVPDRCPVAPRPASTSDDQGQARPAPRLLPSAGGLSALARAPGGLRLGPRQIAADVAAQPVPAECGRACPRRCHPGRCSGRGCGCGPHPARADARPRCRPHRWRCRATRGHGALRCSTRPSPKVPSKFQTSHRQAAPQELAAPRL